MKAMNTNKNNAPSLREGTGVGSFRAYPTPVTRVIELDNTHMLAGSVRGNSGMKWTDDDIEYDR